MNLKMAFIYPLIIYMISVVSILDLKANEPVWYGNDHFNIQTTKNKTVIKMQKKPWESFSVGLSNYCRTSISLAFDIKCDKTINLRVDVLTKTNQKSTLINKTLTAGEYSKFRYDLGMNHEQISHLIFYVNPGEIFNGQMEIQNFSIESITSNINLTHADKIDIYPNPSSDRVFINLPHTDFKSVEVYNCQGIKVRELDVVASEFSFSVNDLSKGVYYLKVNGNDKFEVSKFIVQ